MYGSTVPQITPYWEIFHYRAKVKYSNGHKMETDWDIELKFRFWTCLIATFKWSEFEEIWKIWLDRHLLKLAEITHLFPQHELKKQHLEKLTRILAGGADLI